MNEKLKQFLDAKKEEEEKKYQDEKKKTLIKLGLSERVYAKEGEDLSSFPVSEYDPEMEAYRFYRDQAIDITDEEYEQLKMYLKSTTKSKTSPVAMTIRALAIVVLIGGVIFSAVYDIPTFSWSSFVYAMMTLGFAEIIQLLHEINNK